MRLRLIPIEHKTVHLTSTNEIRELIVKFMRSSKSGSTATLTTCVCVFILSGCGGGGGGSNDTYVASSNSVFGETLILESEFTSTQEILMADVDLDGDIDIISVNQGEPNRLYLNDDISPPIDIDAANGDTNQPLSGDLDDVTGDGAPDLVTANQSGPNHLYIKERKMLPFIAKSITLFTIFQSHCSCLIPR